MYLPSTFGLFLWLMKRSQLILQHKIVMFLPISTLLTKSVNLIKDSSGTDTAQKIVNHLVRTEYGLNKTRLRIQRHHRWESTNREVPWIKCSKTEGNTTNAYFRIMVRSAVCTPCTRGRQRVHYSGPHWLIISTEKQIANVVDSKRNDVYWREQMVFILKRMKRNFPYNLDFIKTLSVSFQTALISNHYKFYKTSYINATVIFIFVVTFNVVWPTEHFTFAHCQLKRHGPISGTFLFLQLQKMISLLAMGNSQIVYPAA